MATVIPPKHENNRFEIPTGFCKKEDFQHFVINTLFPSELYTVVNRTSAYLRNAANPETSGLHPAIMLRDHSNGFEFYIESVFRYALIANQLQFSGARQPKGNQHEHPTFVVLGLGGEAGNPNQVFLLNFRDCPQVSLLKRHLQNKSISATKAILPDQLWAQDASTQFSGKEIA